MKFKNYRSDTKIGKYLREELIQIQNNKCSICNKEFVSSFHTHLDHNHNTGEIRGLLCSKCNFIIGRSRECIDILKNTILYLDSTGTKISYKKLRRNEIKILKDKMLEIQKNFCKICNKEFVSSFHTHLDHNHNTGEIRGLLCNDCNLLLGFSKDNKDILKSSIKYLEENPLKEKLDLLELKIIEKKDQLHKEFILNRKENSKKFWSDVKNKENQRTFMKSYFSDPKNLDKHRISINKPESKDKQKNSSKQYWSKQSNRELQSKRKEKFFQIH